MKIYNVYHLYDVDGGFGDAVPTSELVATFESKADAESFVEKYHNPCVYDIPYAELYCNAYTIMEMEIIPHKDFDLDKTPQDYGIDLPKFIDWPE